MGEETRSDRTMVGSSSQRGTGQGQGARGSVRAVAGRRCSEVNVMIRYWPPGLVSGTASLHFVVLKARQSD